MSVLGQITSQGWDFNDDFDTFLHSSDLLLTPIYVLIILALGVLYAGQKYKDSPFKKYFVPGLAVKLLGAICVGLVYQYYYGGGDTTAYFRDGSLISYVFKKDLSLFSDIMTSNGGADDPHHVLMRVGWLQFFRDPPSFMVDKIIGIITIFCFDTYTPTAVVLAAISFSGAWSLYMTFCKIYPNLYKQFAIAILFIPSVFFWGSGILKDAITFGCLGWFTYASYNIFIARRKIPSSLILFFISAYLILVIKAYIILSFFPSFLFWVFLTYRSKIASPLLQNLITPVILVIGALAGYLIASKLGQDTASKLSVNTFVTKASVYQSWHGYLSESGGVSSGYSLGELSPTAMGALSKFPLAVNVTLFRPYIWEAHNPVLFAAALESLMITLFTLRIIFRTGIFRFFKIVYGNPEVFFCILFSLLFAFAVGYTAYNFGALVRYKIPCIPFYVSALYILDYVTKQDKAKRKLEKNKPIIRYRERLVPEQI